MGDGISVSNICKVAERVGARLGNWNDLRNGGLDDEPRRPRLWRALDRVAGWLYTRGEQP